MKYILGILACLCLGGTTIDSSEYLAIVPDVLPLPHDIVWEATCNAVEELYPEEVDCSKITPPIVVESQIVEDVWVGGRINGVYYWGEPYVFVRPGMTKTMIHEMVHFIAVPLGIATEVCEAEELARKVAGQEWGPDQKAQYGCDSIGTRPGSQGM